VRGSIAVVVFLGLLVYGGWNGLLAVQQYMNVASLVNETVERELPAVSGRDWQPIDRAARIREAIVESARQSGLPIDPRGVLVSEESNVLAVRVTSTYTLARYEDTSLTIPISAARSFPVPPGNR
jgi:hypothetical protein